MTRSSAGFLLRVVSPPSAGFGNLESLGVDGGKGRGGETAIVEMKGTKHFDG